MDPIDRSFLQLVQESPDAILVADREGIIRYWNAGAERIFGWAAAEAVGQSLDLIIPEKQRSRHWEGYRRVMATGETRYKVRLLAAPGSRKDGGRVSLEFSMVMLRDEAGAMQGCASILRDVTDRWLEEKELRARLAAWEEKAAKNV